MKEPDNTLTSKLSPEELENYNRIAGEIAKREGAIKVHPVVLMDPVTFERIVAYIKEPNYMTKVAVMNKMSLQGPFIASMDLVEACLLKTDSDPRTYSETETEEVHRAKLGVLNFCSELVKVLKDQYAKK